MKENSASPKPAGIWIRVSTEDQAKGESPERHEARARLYAEAKGWPVVVVYHLEGVSGKSVSLHAECQKMLADVRAGRIKALIFSKLARLARNTRELLDFADIFRECDCDLISLQESIDTSTPAGRLFYTMIAAMAQWEREETVERVKASVVIRAKLGTPLGGPAPFGYAWKDKKLVPHTQEAPVRKLMYELFLEHRRKKTVVRLLNDAGHRTRNGSRFTSKTVTRLLQDPTAKGVHRANYTSRDSKTKRCIVKPESDWVLNQVKPIVTEELWNQCNALIDQSLQDNSRRPAKKAVHAFAGLAHCECGQKMYVPSNSPKYICKGCKNKIPIVDLEGIFCDEIQGFSLAKDQITAYLQKADETLADKERLLKIQETEQQKLQQEITRVYRLYQDGQLDSQGFGKFYKPLEERGKQLEDAIPRLQAEIDLYKVNSLSAEEVVSEARNLSEQWPSLEAGEKRRIVEAITEKIIVGKGEISITFYHLPAWKEMPKGWRKGWDSNPR
jgi:site-specific DNA recombinase